MSEAEAARVAIVTWLNFELPKPEDLFSTVQGEGGLETGSATAAADANAPAPGLDTPATPSRPEPADTRTRAEVLEEHYGTELVGRGDGRTHYEGEPAEGGGDRERPEAERQTTNDVHTPPHPEPAPPDRPFKPVVAKREHRHTAMKAGMPIPRCQCGAIRKTDGTWHLETRPEADTKDEEPPHTDDEEW